MNMNNLFSFGVTNLNEIMAEIDKMMAERYVFPRHECPWLPSYYTVNDDERSECIYDHSVVPLKTRIWRTMWLANEAHRMLVERRYMIEMPYGTHSSMTPWGVISAAIAMTTYNAILNNDITELWTQARLRDNLGLVGRHISDRSFRQQLADNTNPLVDSRKYNRRNLVEDDETSPEVYYLRTQARVWFVRLCLLRRAILIAATTKQKTTIADAMVYQWTERFDHPMSIIDVARSAHPWPDLTSQRDMIDAIHNENIIDDFTGDDLH